MRKKAINEFEKDFLKVLNKNAVIWEKCSYLGKILFFGKKNMEMT